MMEVLKEEMDVVLAAVRVTELGFYEMAEAARGAGQYAEAHQHANTFNVARAISTKIAHSAGQASFELSEIKFIIASLLTAAGNAEATAAGYRQQLNFAEAEKHVAFMKGCTIIAEKWMKANAVKPGALIH